MPFDPRYPEPAYGYGPPPPRREVTGTPGVLIAALGGSTALAGFFTPWYSIAGGRVRLRDLVHAAGLNGAKALPHAYFGWGVWVTFAFVVTVAILANFPGGASTLLRVLSPVLGLVGAGLLYAALSAGGAHVFDNSSVGLYLTFVGFVVTGLGGVLGPQRR